MRNGIERRLYIAATSQNDGKTTCSLGFVGGFAQLAQSVGFIKPVGQRYLTIDGQRVDEDSVLLQRVWGLRCPLKDMSPIAIERNFTRQYLDNPAGVYPKLEKAIHRSFEIAAEDNDLVLIEGTGHAGVGSVFDLSNAKVARMLNAKVVIVCRGGIGEPVDQIAINQTLFEKEGVPVIGVVANKVAPDKLEQTRDYLAKALQRRGLELLGAIPYTSRLTWPTVKYVAESLDAEVLNGKDYLTNEIAEIVIGAMTPHNALTFLTDRSLLIVPGDRDDIVLAAVTMDLLREDLKISGIILTGNLRLAPQILELVCRTHIPLLAVKTPTYDTASKINDITVKIMETDTDKIQLVTALVKKYVDMEKLWSLLGCDNSCITYDAKEEARGSSL
ncbi:MAG: AAA family ATPase [Kiritimatiellae bacterium]|nr:AAA family ATPase [Kiritimatiellia bacterium]